MASSGRPERQAPPEIVSVVRFDLRVTFPSSLYVCSSGCQAFMKNALKV